MPLTADLAELGNDVRWANWIALAALVIAAITMIVTMFK
jgi:hypothetical protein